MGKPAGEWPNTATVIPFNKRTILLIQKPVLLISTGMKSLVKQMEFIYDFSEECHHQGYDVNYTWHIPPPLGRRIIIYRFRIQ
ncbi:MULTISPECIES: hypothetical protein [Lonsdalea]|uniref:hypothetical protein n=1 Tax=Lonsdalea TaxID=1082702 RepID=UPI00142E659B|nr:MULTISPECIES: hypothetical protein [Lonsdalea]QPQ25961.1 hypothetical protein I6N93_09420 [Lonsdalea populi]